MNAGLNNRDWESLSAYLDSSLSPAETREVEERLLTDHEFNSAFVSLRRTRAILRAVPDVKPRRNFYLTLDMVTQKKWTWLVPAFNFSSAAAGLLATILLVMNLLPMGMQTAPAQQDQMPAPSIPLAAAPPAVEAEMQLAATKGVETNLENSSQPGAVGKVETSTDQGTASSAATGAGAEAPAPVANMFSGEEQATVPPADAPLMSKGDGTQAEGAPVMDAASRIAATPTAAMTMKAASEEKAEAHLVPVPTRVMAQPPVSPTETSTAAGFAPSTEENLAAVNTLTANRVMPEAGIVPPKEQPVGTTRGASTGRLGAYLLLVSVILGITGFYLRKRLR